MKPIRLSRHAQEQLTFRGVSKGEIEETIRQSRWRKAELGRLEARKNFVFESVWNKKYYKTKQVRPIFSEEEREIFVVTVFSYFF